MDLSHLMRRQWVSVPPTTSLRRAHARMVEAGGRHLLVTGPGNLLYGVLSDRDLLRHADRAGDGSLRHGLRTVAEAMSADPICARPTDTISKAAELMFTHKIDALPITNGRGIVLGLVTSSDLLELLVTADDVSDGSPLQQQLRAEGVLP